MVSWITQRSRSFWLSLCVGIVAAGVALPWFSDPWPSNAGGFVFVLLVVTALVRGSIALGHAFADGWRGPEPAAR